MICVDVVLPDPYFTHYCWLVAAILILLSDNIPRNWLQKAELYIQHFYTKFASLYGDSHDILCQV